MHAIYSRAVCLSAACFSCSIHVEAMAARRDSRVPAAVSAAAAVADSVIESVASAARDEGVSPQ
eukprot:21499-Heterococcus_DN1.PRE.1